MRKALVLSLAYEGSVNTEDENVKNVKTKYVKTVKEIVK